MVWETAIFISISFSEVAKALSTDSLFSPTFFYPLEPKCVKYHAVTHQAE